MSRPQLILPQPDAACGKTFFANRQTAEGHRVALEVWDRATGRTRAGYRLVVYRCRRCAGFHIARRPVDRIRTRTVPLAERDRDETLQDRWDSADAHVHRIALARTSWL